MVRQRRLRRSVLCLQIVGSGSVQPVAAGEAPARLDRSHHARRDGLRVRTCCIVTRNATPLRQYNAKRSASQSDVPQPLIPDSQTHEWSSQDSSAWSQLDSACSRVGYKLSPSHTQG